MSINVQCPQCNSGWNVTEAFPGSMVHCANCGCAILLAIIMASNDIKRANECVNI